MPDTLEEVPETARIQLIMKEDEEAPAADEVEAEVDEAGVRSLPSTPRAADSAAELDEDELERIEGASPTRACRSHI